MSPDLDSLDIAGVVGAGTMGSSIAQVAAMAGYDVVLTDVAQDRLDQGFDAIAGSLDRYVEAERLSADAAERVQDRITGTTEVAGLADCDIVVEAVVEDLDVKREVFADLDEVTAEDAVLATNTNTLPVTAIASATGRPDRVVGIHFMNPAQIMNGVEVVAGERTAADVLDLAHAFAEDLGKTTWESADRPGFVTNRVLLPWINEGIRAYDEGVATKTDIDIGLRFGTNVPMGPLELADHVGLDVVLRASERLSEELGDRYRPPSLLRRKVEAGKLGQKTGEGFYEYESSGTSDAAAE